MKRHWGSLLLLVVAAPLTVRAQTTQAADQTELVRALLERIDKLEKRVVQLETHTTETMSSAKTATPDTQRTPANGPGDSIQSQPPSRSIATVASVGPVPATSQTPRTSTHTDQLALGISKDNGMGRMAGHGQSQEEKPEAANSEQASVAQAQQNYPDLHIAGFGSVSYFATNQRDVPQAVTLGQLILHFTSQLSPRVSFFSEWSVSGLGKDVRKLEVERAIIRYDFNDLFKLSFGRYHTPINYWNTAYHHGTWLQTSATRPEWIGFGGSFLPPHFVGALAEGGTPAHGLNFHYDIGVGNGRGFPFSEAGTSFDVNNNKAWLGNFYIKPDRFSHLQVGGSVYHDLLSFPAPTPFAVREFVEAGHIVWNKETPEFIAEFANVHHRKTDTGAMFNSQAFYVQVAYRLPWLEQRFKPYYRIEYLHTPRTDPAFEGIPNEQGSSFVGLRYDFTSFAALKGEYDQQRRRDLAQPVKIFQFSTDFTF
jgi:hypothetical protein